MLGSWGIGLGLMKWGGKENGLGVGDNYEIGTVLNFVVKAM